MELWIIRHGDPDYVHDSLTEKGVREAKLLAERLSKYNISKIYCSPLGRAQKTASYTLEKLGMQAETLPWLREFEGKVRNGLKKSSVGTECRHIGPRLTITIIMSVGLMCRS